MLRSFSLRAASLFTILVVPSLPGCSPQTHEVGDNDGGTTECTSQAGLVCNTPDVHEGCSVTPVTCEGSVVHCGQVSCPAEDDGGACSNGPVVCHLPALGVGCTVGPATCKGGVITCGEITCPTADGGLPPVDAGGCEGDGNITCFGPEVPEGCSVGPNYCSDGNWLCGPVVCPDGGADAAVSPPLCGAPDGLGDGTCPSATTYCEIIPACIELPDGGTNASTTCKPVPSACTDSTNKCDCILNEVEGEPNSGSASVAPRGASCAVTINCD
jgi:hypothetical protein